MKADQSGLTCIYCGKPAGDRDEHEVCVIDLPLEPDEPGEVGELPLTDA